MKRKQFLLVLVILIVLAIVGTAAAAICGQAKRWPVTRKKGLCPGQPSMTNGGAH